MFVMLTVLQQTAQLITFHRWVHAVTAAAVCSWAERFQHILGCQQTLWLWNSWNVIEFSE